MFSILGFQDNITTPRLLADNNTFSILSSDTNSSSIDLGELSVFISALLLSLGGTISIVASSIRRSRCQQILCCGFSKCQRIVPDDPEISV